MARKTQAGAPVPEETPAGSLPHSPKELVMLAKPELGLRAEGSRIASATGTDRDAAKLGELLSRAGAMIRPLFGLSEDRLLARTRALAPEAEGTPADLSLYYHLDAPESQLETLAEELRKLPGVEGAYVKPEAEPPIAAPEEAIQRLNDMAPQAEAPPVTPAFTARQVYLNAAPEGIDALFAWTLAGGGGAGVRVIDCEWGWNFTHEDLLQNQSGVVVGVSSADDNHGTAVLGEISGDRGTFGVTGIAPNAIVGAASFVNKPSAQTIREAADKLSAGDIILLEIHRAGPNATGQGQFGFIAIEWWPDDFAAIRYAVNKGIIVVEAAGNGHQNLDDAVYSVRPAGFPASWTNPFNPANPSSGAVVVGAGNPPSGIHGRTQHPSWGEVYVDRARCVFSNYGQRVDCQGWGWEVTSTGYGDLQGGIRNVWYTDQFSGTSSASPIVVGALACLQGIIKAKGGTLLTSLGAIQLLRASGSPQQSAPNRPATQRIGNRPNLRQLVPSAANTSSSSKSGGTTLVVPDLDSEAPLLSLLERSQTRNDSILHEGYPKEDLNIIGNILIVHSIGSIYSFSKTDIVDSEQLPGGQVRVWIRRGSKGFYIQSFTAGSSSPFTIGMEDIAPPAPVYDPDAPIAATPQEEDVSFLAGTLAGAMAAYTGRCAGGDSYENNCAHFLSDAFIRSGFSELAGNNPHINARCNTSARRPIRARDMWSWFQSKARRTSRTVQRNTGNWAIFQLNERVYWGGHVVLLNSNTWEYYGTGWYGDWNQYLYQW